MKPRLIIVTLGALAVLIVLVVIRSSESLFDELSQASEVRSEAPLFEVRVVKPRSSRPLFGILPSGLFGVPSELGFSHADSAARIERPSEDRLDLTADGWRLSIATDDSGEVTEETALVFSLELANKTQTLRCRPGSSGETPLESLRESLGFETETSGDLEAPDVGFLESEIESGVLSGRFELRLGLCSNASTGKAINWPPAPLTVFGWFDGVRLDASG